MRKKSESEGKFSQRGILLERHVAEPIRRSSVEGFMQNSSGDFDFFWERCCMLSKSSLFPGAILVATIFVFGCNEKTPTGPSALPSVTPSSETRLIGAWNLTVRITETSGKGKQCVIESLRSEIDTHNQYSLALVQKGDRAELTLASASGDYMCTFPAVVDNSGFTEGPGYYTCAREQRVLSCDGTQHTLLTLGQGISGRFSGSEVSGNWSAFWVDVGDDEDEFEMKAQFTGSK
jgi:hypothetical protein